jgi:hypothetical protein
MTFETEFKKRVRYQIPVERDMIDAIVIRCVILLIVTSCGIG